MYSITIFIIDILLSIKCVYYKKINHDPKFGAQVLVFFCISDIETTNQICPTKTVTLAKLKK